RVEGLARRCALSEVIILCTDVRWPLGGSNLLSSLRRATPHPLADAIGSADHGAVLFAKYCASCHGSGGVGGIPNPGSNTGQVPQRHRIGRALSSSEPQIFAENIDRSIQHGPVASGLTSQFRMPGFGDINTLTRQEIADPEAYILRLNGVDRA
ncbi:MAG: c-type cytochrome, partial [Alphaproteobacteria bacterium]